MKKFSQIQIGPGQLWADTASTWMGTGGLSLVRVWCWKFTSIYRWDWECLELYLRTAFCLHDIKSTNLLAFLWLCPLVCQCLPVWLNISELFRFGRADIKEYLRVCALIVIICPNNSYFADLCVVVRGFRRCLKLVWP
jgi:hypothetical protein